MHDLPILTLILFLSLLANYLCKKIQMPAVIGQMFIGIVFGPALFNIIKPSEFITIFAEIGVILLMFIAGLESNLSLLKKYFKPSMLVAIFGVIFPLIGMYLASYYHGLNVKDSMFVSVIFAATSVSISVEVLKEMGKLNSKEGITILGAAVADDVIAILLLSFASFFLGSQNSGSSNIVMVVLLQILFFILVLMFIKFGAKLMLSLAYHFKINLTILSLAVCFLAAYLAELCDLSSITGAFFAGIAISQTPFKKKIRRNTETIGYSLFIPIFFVNIGLSLQFNGIFNQLLLLTTITILSIFTKLFGAGLGAKLSGFSLNSSTIVGSGMVSRGEVALIIAQIGLSRHLISENYYSVIIAAVVITTFLSPFILRQSIVWKKRLSHNE
ncbi:cation:proton antiporter [Apilactobacillus xinyiensis]|uniref:cation:proton antiporter n=1 Tax=Apilactobacillus xinyiensis TaxID=2841032 RepID=UPI0020109036|nr:cation:proton antiporter [Apilactobacillus xinyiensis]MCL0318336.1 cation:proton antiporter [Apilactobacillus xinyiensis]